MVVSAPRNVRTTFAFFPPEDSPAAWQASLDTFTRALERAFPGAVLKHRVDPLRGLEVMDFDVEVAPDVWITGRAAMPEPDYAYVTAGNATADEAALFAQWLRDSYLPSPAVVWFNTSAAMENGMETPSPLPATGDSSEIEAFFRNHLASAGVE
jgi:hypothetical protein